MNKKFESKKNKRIKKAQYYRNSQNNNNNKKQKIIINEENKNNEPSKFSGFLSDNLHGILISCNNNEYRSLKDAYTILNETADRLYGQFNDDDKKKNNNNLIDVEEDIEASIQTEIASLKIPAARRFIQTKTKCNNVLFVQINDNQIEPNQLVEAVFNFVRETMKANSRYIQRFIPVCGTFKAIGEQMDRCLDQDFRRLFTQYAPKNVQTYSVMAKVRNNSAFKSTTAIRTKMIEVIKEERPNWFINHSTPQQMIVINILQRAGAVSILPDFYRLSKYNLVEYASKCEQGIEKKEEKVNVEKIEEEEIIKKGMNVKRENKEDDEMTNTTNDT